ncbi:XRE family transcriptional regulator [Ligilactobacillus salitolerans]|uniref:XRE family transcriptional regulator n=1 Tax=Ligilactobacillus salitolerans TaxID=1808352 RepID=A0A401IUM0_9LACO|nr:helix-turn-helix transcriptional regulator [Ligilactobacillus salitolerans]GBG95224.1 XRE family transcriptional regulator [Ligilactobacillus salitolerans]
MTVYENIKKYSKMRGLNLQQVAEKAGLSKNMLYQYKNMNPKVETLDKIAKVLNVTKEDLLGSENGKPKHIDLADDDLFMTYQGKPLSDEDKELIKRILRGK